MPPKVAKAFKVNNPTLRKSHRLTGAGSKLFTQVKSDRVNTSYLTTPDTAAAIDRIITDTIEILNKTGRVRISVNIAERGQKYGPGHTFGFKKNDENNTLEVWDHNKDMLYLSEAYPEYNRIIDRVFDHFKNIRRLTFPKVHVPINSPEWIEYKRICAPYTKGGEGGDGACNYWFDNFVQFKK